MWTGRDYFGPGFPNCDPEVFFGKGVLLTAQIEGPGISSALLVCRNFRQFVAVNMILPNHPESLITPIQKLRSVKKKKKPTTVRRSHFQHIMCRQNQSLNFSNAALKQMDRHIYLHVAFLGIRKKGSLRRSLHFSPNITSFFQVGFMPSVELNAGLELTTLRSRPELRSSQTFNRLSHPDTPCF